MRGRSFITGVLTLLVLGMAWHERYPQRLWHRWAPPAAVPPLPYDQHPSYLEQAPLQALYAPRGARILMLGTSFTYRAAWNELLGRCDVLNRGVPSDVTAGLYARLQPLLQDTALRICFVEGGGNDLPRGVPMGQVLYTLHRISDSLRAHRIEPVLTTTPLCSGDQPRWREANLRIATLNAALRLEAPLWGVSVLDLSALLSGGAEILPRTYAVPSDGVHLTAPAYRIWRDAVQAILARQPL